MSELLFVRMCEESLIRCVVVVHKNVCVYVYQIVEYGSESSRWSWTWHQNAHEPGVLYCFMMFHYILEYMYILICLCSDIER